MGMNNSKSLFREKNWATSKNITFTTKTESSSLIEEEVDRWQVSHHLTKTVFGSNYSAPITYMLKHGGAQVLDVGCGPGTWLFDMASDFPKSYFFGAEIATIFPTIKPFNVQIVHANVLNKLPWKEGVFDLVFMRHFLRWFTVEQWEQKVIPELVRLVKVGGWIELLEADYTYIGPGPILSKFQEKALPMMRMLGRDPKLVDRLPSFLMGTNHFVDIQHEKREIPLGKWGGIVGKEFAKNVFTVAGHTFMALNIIQKKDFEKTVAMLLNEADEVSTSIVYHRFFAKRISRKDDANYAEDMHVII